MNHLVFNTEKIYYRIIVIAVAGDLHIIKEEEEDVRRKPRSVTFCEEDNQVYDCPPERRDPWTAKAKNFIKNMFIPSSPPSNFQTVGIPGAGIITY